MQKIQSLTQKLEAEPHVTVSPSTLVGERVVFLYEAYRAKIYYFLVAQGLNIGTAQDLSQDVFVRFFVALSKGTKIESERAWLYGVAAKLATDHWRREGRPMWMELDSIPAFVDNLPSSDATPEASLFRRERVRRVAREMARLPKEQRLTIHLRMQGLRYRSIAEILGVSTSTAAEWLSLAVTRLRSAADE
jgi:RNA polymerase sigma-70 factor (ECF subfamily)